MAKKTLPAKKKAPARKAAPVAKPVIPAGLTPLEAMFAREYLVDSNGTKAYLRVKPGAKETTARTEGSKLLAKPHVAAEIERLRQEQAARTGITADRVVKEAWNILTADPRELMEFRVGCCRHCWGKGFLYQRTDSEYSVAVAANKLANRTLDAKRRPGPFEPQGGPGFDMKRDPNPECPECAGEGKGRTVFRDTRNISAAAASLFAGVKESKEGLEIKLHSKDAAMDKLFRHFGIYNDKLTLTVPTVVVKDFTGKKGPEAG